MYPYISREDCLYTDTDSVVLRHPLPEEDIHSSALGKFKLEARIKIGHFLAPKCYSYTTIDGEEVIKYKGQAKSKVYPEWFELQYDNPSRKEKVLLSFPIRPDFKTLEVRKKEVLVTLGIKMGRKRREVFRDGRWCDTEPIEVTDIPYLNSIGIQIVQSLKNQLNQLQNENRTLKDRLFTKNTENKEEAERTKSQKLRCIAVFSRIGEYRIRGLQDKRESAGTTDRDILLNSPLTILKSGIKENSTSLYVRQP